MFNFLSSLARSLNKATIIRGIIREEYKSKNNLLFYLSYKTYITESVVIFRRNPLASAQICYFGT
jgi:hypothetical protein